MPVEWIWWVVVPGAIVAVCVIGQIAGFMDFSTKGKDWKRSSGNIMGPIDGLFAPNRQEALQEQERQTELPAPAPAPGDPLLDLDKGIAALQGDGRPAAVERAKVAPARQATVVERAGA